jgi:hypothetical protein
LREYFCAIVASDIEGVWGGGAEVEAFVDAPRCEEAGRVWG